MRILWVCSIPLPEIAKDLGKSLPTSGGWISGMFHALNGNETASLAICFPDRDYSVGESAGIKYYAFTPTEECFKKIINDYSPDIVHIFGTEAYYSYACIIACNDLDLLDRTVINIQGLISVIAKHYTLGINNRILHSYSFRDFLRRDNIFKQMLGFKKRGEFEETVLKTAKHVIGRTDWDKACITRLNPYVQYHFCNETLRPAFYRNEWSLKKCERHSIFVSQSWYPVKGFHFMLEAMADIVKKYPDAKLYTTGKNPLALTFKQKLRQGYYNKYLGKLIKKYHLENNVEFLGSLDEEKMCKQYLKSHVFVCCSSIENSPNSLGEAMILGVPCVSSDVGGVKNLMQHEKEGYVYQADAPYMLSYYIQEIFKNDSLALEFSKNAKAKASATHNADTNFDRLIEIYQEISKTN